MRPNKFLAPRRVAGLFLCAILILGGTVSVEGQSGRRPPKRPTSPDPLPPAPSEPPLAEPSTQDKKTATPILLARDLQDVAFSSDIFLNAVVDGFMDRMQKVASVKARPSAKHMNRAEASDAAKGSDDTYVVWCQLRGDSTGAMNSDARYAQDLYVEYTLYSPGTGKPKTSGHVYQRSQRGVPFPGPSPTPRTAGSLEYTLRYAGVELAERVLSSLNLASTPPIK
ncbi:MAG TPA: hypothetical protein VJZ26_17285 [Blastocatellia bacterium]|nr:hypothetical protein [Blastocatellia bacterium]